VAAAPALNGLISVRCWRRKHQPEPAFINTAALPHSSLLSIRAARQRPPYRAQALGDRPAEMDILYDGISAGHEEKKGKAA